MADMELWFIDLERVSAALETIEAETPSLAEVDKARLDAMTNAAARRERRLAVGRASPGGVFHSDSSGIPRERDLFAGARGARA